jgi:general secretion pathway protein C
MAGARAMMISQRKALNLLLLVVIFATATYWVLQLTSATDRGETVVAVPTADRAARTQAMNVAPIARLFGSSEVSSVSSNIAVVGVIAQGGKNQGVALLSVDSGPAMAFKAGQRIDDGSALKRVNANGVVIERNGSALELLLPARQPPSGIEPVQ